MVVKQSVCILSGCCGMCTNLRRDQFSPWLHSFFNYRNRERSRWHTSNRKWQLRRFHFAWHFWQSGSLDVLRKDKQLMAHTVLSLCGWFFLNNHDQSWPGEEVSVAGRVWRVWMETNLPVRLWTSPCLWSCSIWQRCSFVSSSCGSLWIFEASCHIQWAASRCFCVLRVQTQATWLHSTAHLL